MAPRFLFGGALRVYTSAISESALARLRRALLAQSESIREDWRSAIGLPPEKSGRVRLLLYLETLFGNNRIDIHVSVLNVMHQLFNRFDVGDLEGVFIGGGALIELSSGATTPPNRTQRSVLRWCRLLATRTCRLRLSFYHFEMESQEVRALLDVLRRNVPQPDFSASDPFARNSVSSWDSRLFKSSLRSPSSSRAFR